MLEKTSVKFGSVNTGKDHVRISLSMDRGRLTLEQAEENLCGYRLQVRLTCRPQRAQNSAPLPGMEDADLEFEGIADAKKYLVSRGNINSGLTFAIAAIDATHLLPFAQREGWLQIISKTEIPEADESDDVVQVGSGEYTAPRLLVDEGKDPGAAQPVRGLNGVTKALADSLEAAGIVTVRHLEKRMAQSGGAPWYKDIKGIGETKHDLLMDAILTFRQTNPVPEVEDENPDQVEIQFSPEDLQEAYQYGSQAQHDDKAIEANPYPSDDPRFEHWRQGWYAMKNAIMQQTLTTENFGMKQDDDGNSVFAGGEYVAAPLTDEELSGVGEI